MGHLVNPIAYRLGWSSNWVHSFYANTLYYPEYLHAILRIRAGIYHFFSACYGENAWRRYLLHYSHTEIRKISYSLFIHIYVYDPFLEELSYTLFTTFIRFKKSLKRINFLQKRRKNPLGRFPLLYHVMCMILLLVLFHPPTVGFSIKVKLKQLMRLVFFFSSWKRFYRRLDLLKGQYKVSAWSLKKRYIFNYMVAFFCLIQLYYVKSTINKKRRKKAKIHKSLRKKEEKKLHKRMSSLLGRCLYDYVLFNRLGAKYMGFKTFFEYTSAWYSPFKDIRVYFFFFSNMRVTASFLARYIASLVYQGATLQSVMRPLKRELNRVLRIYGNVKMAKYQRSLRERSGSIGYLTLHYSWVHIRALLRRNISFFLLYYKKESNIFYKKEASLIYNNYLLLVKNIKDMIKKRANMISVFFHFLKRQGLLIFLSDTFRTLSKHISTSFISSKTVSYIYNNIWCDIDWAYDIMHDSMPVNFKAILMANTCYFNFVNRFYYNNTYAIALRNINKMKERKKNTREIRSGIFGYKFHCVGRFTRKDRTSSIRYKRGGLPLTSMHAKIDYGTFSVPLRNSLANIKVWLYKGKDADKRVFFKEFEYDSWL